MKLDASKKREAKKLKRTAKLKKKETKKSARYIALQLEKARAFLKQGEMDIARISEGSPIKEYATAQLEIAKAKLKRTEKLLGVC